MFMFGFFLCKTATHEKPFTWVILLSALRLTPITEYDKVKPSPLPVTENLFIITIDGFRWREVFDGADSALLFNEEYTPDTASMKLLYWSEASHGRGSKENKWTSHGEFIKGSSQTWMALIGPGIRPMGEIKDNEQLYQQQLAQTIAHLLGEDFMQEDIAPPITLR